MFLAGLSGLVETDFKKVVALSTLRQLGLMVTRLGGGLLLIRFFHLVVHAYAKALLFIAVGYILHSRMSYQDSRVIKILPIEIKFIYSVVFLSNLRLAGGAFMSGFFSKEIILEGSWGAIFGTVEVLLRILACVVTVIYSFRILLVLAPLRRKSLRITHMSPPTPVFIWACLPLMVFRVAGGWLWEPLFEGGPLILPASAKICGVLILPLGVRLYLLFQEKIGRRSIRWAGSIWCLPFLLPKPRENSLRLSRLLKERDQSVVEELTYSLIKPPSPPLQPFGIKLVFIRFVVMTLL